MDFEPKPGSTMLCHSLPNLGEMVHREIEAAAQASTAENLLYRAMDTYWDGSVLINTLGGPWIVQYANEAFSNMTGEQSSSKHVAREASSLHHLVDRAESLSSCFKAVSNAIIQASKWMLINSE